MNCIADAILRLHEPSVLLKKLMVTLNCIMVCYYYIGPCLCVCLFSAVVFCFSGTLMSVLAKDLQYEVLYYSSHTFSENTKQTYKSHLDFYTQFCLFMNIPAVPATTHYICMYAAFLARSMKPTFNTQYVSTTELLHKEFDLANPLTDNHFLNSLCGGIDRVRGDSHVQKLPITVNILFRLFKLINFKSGFQYSGLFITLTSLVCFANPIYFLLLLNTFHLINN